MDVETLLLTVLVVIPYADVGTFRDDVCELSGIRIHTSIVRGIHQVLIV